MKPKHVKTLLKSKIKEIASNLADYCYNPKSDFSRHRKLTMEKVISGVIGLESGSLTNEILDMFETSKDTPTCSAFIQQRSKITPEAFGMIFRSFSQDFIKTFSDEIPILAIDGSKIQIATNPEDTDSFFTGSNGQRPYNLLHLKALYNIQHHLYDDVILQKAKQANEHRALTEMVDCSLHKKALLIADRGYESYNNLAHIQEKDWYYLIRIKDGKNGIKQGWICQKLNHSILM